MNEPIDPTPPRPYVPQTIRAALAGGATIHIYPQFPGKPYAVASAVWPAEANGGDRVKGELGIDASSALEALERELMPLAMAESLNPRLDEIQGKPKPNPADFQAGDVVRMLDTHGADQGLAIVKTRKLDHGRLYVNNTDMGGYWPTDRLVFIRRTNQEGSSYAGMKRQLELLATVPKDAPAANPANAPLPEPIRQFGPAEDVIERRKFYERHEDMSPTGRLQLLMEEDGDIIVQVIGEEAGSGAPRIAQVQFCGIGAGGGRSPNTRRALQELFRAIAADNLQRPIPSHDYAPE